MQNKVKCRTEDVTLIVLGGEQRLGTSESSTHALSVKGNNIHITNTMCTSSHGSQTVSMCKKGI